MSLAVLVAFVAALAMWMRSRSRPIQVDDPPEWPPLPPLDDETPSSGAGGPAEADTELGTEADGEAGTEPGSTTAPAPAETAWRESDDDGACPDGFPIKANDNSGIFHVPGGRFYDRTKPDRCYPDAASAVADGYRQAKT